MDSLEALILWNGLTSDHISWELTEEQGFEDALCCWFGGGDAEDPDRVLQAVYLEDMERCSGHVPAHRTRAAPSQKDHVWFGRVVEVGRKRGVDVHTCTNTYPQRYEQTFPEAPDRYSWKTGPWGERPSDWVFDVYEGRRRRGCGKCGDCEGCLALYSRELWDGAKKEKGRIKKDGKNVRVKNVWEGGKEREVRPYVPGHTV